MRSEVSFACRRRTPLALLMADVDGLSRVNDERGRPAGDVTLREVARRWAPALRAEDVLARHAGAGFAVLCRETSASQALVLAGRLRALAADPVPMPSDAAVRITVSAGIAVLPRAGIHTDADLVRAATAALQEAKRRGRDRVVVFDELS